MLFLNRKQTMPISQKQLEANQTNAKKSTGPTSPKGKNRSRMNALRHGLSGHTVLLSTEDMAAYQKFSTALATSLGAETPLELQFAQTIADNQWRINRVKTIEDGMLALGHFEDAGDFETDNPETHTALTAARAFRDDPKSFVSLSLCEQRLHSSLRNALKQLQDLQDRRRRQHTADLENAVRLHKLDIMENRTPNTAADGFVFSTGEVAVAARRQKRNQQAVNAERVYFDHGKYCQTIFGTAPKDRAA